MFSPADILNSSRTAVAGEPGELMVRGPLVMFGYHNNPEATSEAIEPNGWLHAGDIAVMDEVGYGFIVDRQKDMIITAGYNVYPAEVERVLAERPAVALVAVGAVPDEEKGEVACAYVVLANDAAVTEQGSSTTPASSWRPTSARAK